MEEKKCSKCGDVKLLSEFGKRLNRPSGVKSACKDCHKEIRLIKSRTISGLIKNIYAEQIHHSRTREHANPEYSLVDLEEWILSNSNFNSLYDNWVKSDYNKWERPSVDRLKDNIGYSLLNIRLTTWRINNKKSHTDKLNGIITHDCVAVKQFELIGAYIKTFVSVNSASRASKTSTANIIRCCQGKQTRAGNFIWKYESDSSEVTPTSKSHIKVYKIDKIGIVLDEFESIRDANRKTGVCRYQIKKLAKLKRGWCYDAK